MAYVRECFVKWVRQRQNVATPRNARSALSDGSSPIKANAAKQILEPRVGAQRVKAGPHEDPRVKALRIGFFEPGHGLILVVQTYVDQGNLGSI